MSYIENLQRCTGELNRESIGEIWYKSSTSTNLSVSKHDMFVARGRGNFTMLSIKVSAVVYTDLMPNTETVYSIPSNKNFLLSKNTTTVNNRIKIM